MTCDLACGVEQQKGILGFTHAHEREREREREPLRRTRRSRHRRRRPAAASLSPLRPPARPQRRWARCPSCGWLCAYSGGKAIIHGQSRRLGERAGERASDLFAACGKCDTQYVFCLAGLVAQNNEEETKNVSCERKKRENEGKSGGVPRPLPLLQVTLTTLQPTTDKVNENPGSTRATTATYVQDRIRDQAPQRTAKVKEGAEVFL